MSTGANTISPTPIPSTEGVRRRWLSVALVPVVLVVLFVAGYWPRRSATRALTAAAAAVEHSLPRVGVTTAVAVDGGRSLTLPGSLVAVRQAMINARATGYVSRWHVDIGDRVRAGDVLADLETPEIDQQLQQARAARKQQEAALEQAVANRDFAKISASRQDVLVSQGLVAKQDADQADAQFKVGEANVHAAEANVEAAQATVRQLLQLVSFGHVVAPTGGSPSGTSTSGVSSSRAARRAACHCSGSKRSIRSVCSYRCRSPSLRASRTARPLMSPSGRFRGACSRAT
jgi:multidrug efflux pump subunit AcrA (membrane-fusion protein)